MAYNWRKYLQTEISNTGASANEARELSHGNRNSEKFETTSPKDKYARCKLMRTSIPTNKPNAFTDALFIIFTAILLLAFQGCGKKLPFPDQSTVPPAKKLAIDGTWRLVSGNITSVFRIDMGRMYYYDRQKPPRGTRQENIPGKSSEILSATDYSRRPGNVVAMGIRETADGTVFPCKTAVYNLKKKSLEFTPGELRIVSPTRVILKAFSRTDSGLVETVSDGFEKVTLDNESWFTETAVGGSEFTFGSSPSDMTRKITEVPPEKMESSGRLSSTAKDFIRQTVRSARVADGSVEIRYPPSTPEQIIESLRQLGVEVSEDSRGSIYQLIIIKPSAR